MSKTPKTLPPRKDVPREQCWDLTRFFKNEEELQTALKKLPDAVRTFCDEYRGQLAKIGAADLLRAVRRYEEICNQLSECGIYIYCRYDTEHGNSEYAKAFGSYDAAASSYYGDLDFFISEISSLEESTLREAGDLDDKYRAFFRDILLDLPHRLSPDVERSLVLLRPIFSFPYECYSLSKMTDLRFAPFETSSGRRENSYVLYENHYANSADPEERREAFRSFSEGLRTLHHTTGAVYNAHIQHEKVIASMRGFDSVFDYLLHQQHGSRPMYEGQIDQIMRDLSPVMRRYAECLRKKLGLEEIHFADLRANLFPDTRADLTLDDAANAVSDAVAIMGEEYRQMVMRYREERWCDFAMNEGKSTGGYCGSSPISAAPYILMSWSGSYSELYTLIHELGHAANFLLSHPENSRFQASLPMAFVEAPSTFHELLLSGSLLDKAESLEEEQRVLAKMLANTYYHNFVTHLLEADFQRKVYRAVDRGEQLTADDFDRLMRETLENFWGDSIVLDEGCELTWMRQPHYYMGLYSYTYSVGLTLASHCFLRLRAADEKERKEIVRDWLNFLAFGERGSLEEIASVAQKNFCLESSLRKTIDFLSDCVDKLER